MKTINIFHISSFPFYSGGIDTWLYNFLLRYDEQYEINLICPIYTHENKEQIFDTKPFKNTKIIYINESKSNFLFSLIKRFFLYEKNLKYVSSIKKAHINIVLSTYPVGFVVKWLKFRKIINGKLIMSVRGCVARDMIDLNESPFTQKIFFLLEKYSMNLYDILVSNGNDTQNYLEKNFNFASFVIPNSITIRNSNKKNTLPSIAELKRKYKIISHVGTLRKIKNISKLIEATSIVQKNHSEETLLVLAGKGNIQYYRDYSEKIDAHVIFLDELKNYEVNCLLELSDIVVNISYGCGVSNSLLEALAHGCKVVAFDRDTFNQVIINNDNGYLAIDQNTKSLAKTIIYALNDTSIKKDHIINSIQRYDCANVFKKWDEILK